MCGSFPHWAIFAIAGGMRTLRRPTPDFNSYRRSVASLSHSGGKLYVLPKEQAQSTRAFTHVSQQQSIVSLALRAGHRIGILIPGPVEEDALEDR